MVHEPFAAAVAACEDPAVADMLGKLCALNGLWTLERDIGWFLEHGYVSGAKSRAIRKEVSALCLEVRGQALPLIDAFGIPEQCLGAPIIQP